MGELQQQSQSTQPALIVGALHKARAEAQSFLGTVAKQRDCQLLELRLHLAHLVFALAQLGYNAARTVLFALCLSIYRSIDSALF